MIREWVRRIINLLLLGGVFAGLLLIIILAFQKEPQRSSAPKSQRIREWARRIIGSLLVFGFSLGLLFIIVLAIRKEQRPPSPSAPEFLPRLISLEVTPPGLRVNQGEALRIRAPAIEATRKEIMLEIPELRFKERITAADLQRGVPTKKLYPQVAGILHLQARMDDRIIGTSSIPVARSQVAGGNEDLKFELDFGPAIPHTGGDMTVSVFAVVVPSIGVPSNVTVTLKDVKTNQPIPGPPLTILKGRPKSDSINMTLSEDTNCQLIGQVEYQDGNPQKSETKPKTLSWRTRDIQYELDASSSEASVPATSLTPASVTVSLVYKKLPYYTAKPLSLIPRPQANTERVVITPKTLIIDSNKYFINFEVASSKAQEASIDFFPSFDEGNKTNLKVRFESVAWFYWVALLAAICGRLIWLLGSIFLKDNVVTQWKSLNRDQIFRRLIAELFTGLVGAWLFCFVFFNMGELKVLDLHLSPLNITRGFAAIIGVLGGVVGGIGALKMLFPQLNLPS